jgi:sugar lactone lactonase YvrE
VPPGLPEVIAVRTLSMAFLLTALASAGPARAASTAGGLRLEKAVYTDAADVALRRPEGVACDGRGALVVADTGNGRLLVYGWKDGVLEGGTQVKLAQLPHPVRVQIDSKGFVLALDRRARKIVKVDAKGAFAGYVEAQGTTLTAAAFRVDSADDLYVLDVVAAKVLVLSPEGKVKRDLPLPRAAGITDVAVDSGGRIYLVDAVTAVVFAAEPGAKAFQPITKSLKEMVSFPTYVAPDNRGKLYVVDQNGNGIVKLGVDGAFLGRELSIGASDGSLYYPGQLCVGAEGDLWIADRNNNRIQVFSQR